MPSLMPRSASSSSDHADSDASHGQDRSSSLFSQRNCLSPASVATTSLPLTSSLEGVGSSFLAKLNAARRYLVEELSKLSSSEMGQDQARIAALIEADRSSAEQDGKETDTASSMYAFWQSISDGVILCLLVTCLMPRAIERIDRRELDWIKAENISRFLRAVRDHLGIRSKDLFHPLDVTDATVEGLDRVVRTILIVKRTAQELGMSVRSPSSPFNAVAMERAPYNRRSLVVSPPLSPLSGPSMLLTQEEDQSQISIQQHRQATEAKLVSQPDTGRSTSNLGERDGSGFREGNSPTFAAKTTSIHFAPDCGSQRSAASADNSGSVRNFYRTSKFNDSTVSLTDVAEEKAEELKSSDSQMLRPIAAQDIAEQQRKSDAPPADRSTEGSRASVAVARSRSQRRISQELGFGNSLQPTSGRLGQGSALYQTPQRPGGLALRRHSAQPSIPSTKTSPTHRSSIAHDQERDGVPPTATRLLFPGSPLKSTAESSTPDATVDEAAPTRPDLRHHRFRSEMQVPRTKHSSRDSSFVHVPLSSSPLSSSPLSSVSFRPRADSDAGHGSASHSDARVWPVRPKLLAREASISPTARHCVTVTQESRNVSYQLGDCIGRGQFGSVYRALNLSTGQMVAVKRIKIEGKTEDEITQLMKEVDLLKSLSHPSVVKYEGLERGVDAVSIVLEYAENGSLLNTLKAFGEFPEKLVASYVVKILEGLTYLHMQEVVHCDLKAANILTTKTGNVKLSDFGVSLNLRAMEKVQQNDAVGTPYWMAPEIIELQGASTAADIWSLGCTIIELLTGKPPYGDMLAMSALFRIVEDERPAIPENASPALHDFLVQCFQKDPTKRPTAAHLFAHEWLRDVWASYKELRLQDSVPFMKRISLDQKRPRLKDIQASIDDGDAPSTSNAGAGMSTAPLASPGQTRTASPSGVGHLHPSAADPAVSTPTKSELAQATTPEPHGRHSFIKSSFSKAMKCRLCHDSVRKQAMLCEECGLVCHAVCAKEAGLTCSKAHRYALERSLSRQSESSPTASVSSGRAVSPSSPSALSAAFKLPFVSSRNSYSNTNVSQQNENAPPANSTPSGHKRRISLLPSSVLRPQQESNGASDTNAQVENYAAISLPQTSTEPSTPSPQLRPSQPVGAHSAQEHLSRAHKSSQSISILQTPSMSQPGSNVHSTNAVAFPSLGESAGVLCDEQRHAPARRDSRPFRRRRLSSLSPSSKNGGAVNGRDDCTVM